MLGSSKPQGPCSNASIHCSGSSKCLCTLCTGLASQRAPSIFASRTVRKICPTVPAAVCATLFGKQELSACSAFPCYLVNLPPPPSLLLEPTSRGPQPHDTTCFTTCYVVATGFLHPVEPQAPLTARYPADYTSCIADPIRCTKSSRCSHCSLCSLNPG